MPYSPLQSHQASIYINAVDLVVRDLKGMVAFYRDVVGLTVLKEDGEEASLGTGETVFLRLKRDQQARSRSPDMPGLFHTAFLLPTRGHLGAWLHHALKTQVPLEGLSDHNVSEAAYLSDIEGNGVEIYWDRPVETWLKPDGTIQMGTARMNVQSVLAEPMPLNSGPYRMPQTTRIGHVHLSVSDLDDAGRVLQDVIGMGKKASYPQADFYASGNYHHHIAANTWHLSGVKTYQNGLTGLSLVTLEVPQIEERQKTALRLEEAGGKLVDERLLFEGPSGIPFALKLTP